MYPYVTVTLNLCILVSMESVMHITVSLSAFFLYPCIPGHPCIPVSLYPCSLVFLFPVSLYPCILVSLYPCILYSYFLIFISYILVSLFSCLLNYLQSDPRSGSVFLRDLVEGSPRFSFLLRYPDQTLLRVGVKVKSRS